MAPPRTLPSDAILRKWRIDEGLSLKEILDRIKEAEGCEVPLGTLASALSRAGITERVRYEEFIPWTPIKLEHNQAYPLVMLRLLARREHGLPEKVQDKKKLDAWLRRLHEEEAVVTYRYDSEHGFYYVRRKDTDHPQIPIRMPKASPRPGNE